MKVTKSFLFVELILCVVHCYSATIHNEINENTRLINRGQVSAVNARSKRENGKRYLLFDNRSGRRAELRWMDQSRKMKVFMVLKPDSALDINTFNTHTWFAIEKSTNKHLLINGKSSYKPREKSTLENRTFLVITNPGHPKTEIPEKYIKTLVVADYSTLQRFGSVANVTRYVMTLFRLATEVFHHKTMTQHGIKINVVLSKIVVLQKKHHEIKIGYDYGESSLNHACDYMGKVAKRGNVKFDHMLFLTRKGFGSGGYASPYTMCSSRSCSIIYDHGFTTTFVIAHEMAHTFGLDDKNFKEKDQSYIMSGLIRSKFGQYEWSPYSQAFMLSHFRTYSCINNRPKINSKDFPFVHNYPGVHYTLDEQCRLEYGDGYTVWPKNWNKYSCDDLKCEMPDLEGFWKRLDSPPLDGTKCGKNMWCVKGKCQKRNEIKQKTNAIHGNWSRWGAWSSCSMTCDVGVQTRKRYCNNPTPRYGGKKCVGMAMEVAKCTTGKKCLNTYNILKQQCVTLGAKHRWRKWDLYNETKVNLDCTFKTDTCGWKNEMKNDDQDWQLHKGKTQSEKTGPSGDHTTNSAKGQYIYFETSPRVSRVGYKARLNSPRLSVPQGCLIFWYSMFGDNKMGTLRVIKNNEKWSRTIWTRSGNQGDKWHQGRIEIKDSSIYQIVFEAEKSKKTYRSDIALDDVTFTPGPCSNTGQKVNNDVPSQCSLTCTTVDSRDTKLISVPTPDGQPCQTKTSLSGICYQGKCNNVGCDRIIDSGTTYDRCNVCGGDGTSCSAILNDQTKIKAGKKTPKEPPLVPVVNKINCDFKKNTCSWRNALNNDNLNWLRNLNGLYLYVKLFPGKQSNGRMKASIMSGKVTAPNACLTFKYRMTGKNAFRLKVKLVGQQKLQKGSIWSKRGPTGKDWVEAQVKIKMTSPYQIILQGVVTKRYNANISVKDIKFRSESCPNK